MECKQHAGTALLYYRCNAGPWQTAQISHACHPQLALNCPCALCILSFRAQAARWPSSVIQDTLIMPQLSLSIQYTRMSHLHPRSSHTACVRHEAARKHALTGFLAGMRVLMGEERLLSRRQASQYASTELSIRLYHEVHWTRL